MNKPDQTPCPHDAEVPGPWFSTGGGGAQRTIGNVWRQFFHNPGVRVLLAIQGVGVRVVKAQDGPEQAVYLPQRPVAPRVEEPCSRGGSKINK